MHQEPEVNPFHIQNEMQDALGGFAQFCWTLQCNSAPGVLDLDNEVVREYKELQDYSRYDFESHGADAALQRLGDRWEVSGSIDKGKDAIIVLPYHNGILESTREIGYFDAAAFSLFETGITVSEHQLASRPDDSQLVDRILWALRLHRDWVAPRLKEQGYIHTDDGWFSDPSHSENVNATNTTSTD